jgi:hypothetical protein
VLLVHSWTPTLAADSSRCGPENLLQSASVFDSLDVEGSAAVLTDRTIVREGSPYSVDRGVRFRTGAGSLTYDLGDTMPIGAVFLQGNAGSAYAVQVSNDGATFREIWRSPGGEARRPGMRSRHATFWDVRARYVRVGEPTGGTVHAISELSLHCEIPDVFPPLLAVVDVKPPHHPRRFQLEDAVGIKILLAAFGAALLAWTYVLRRRGAPERHRKLRDGLLVGLAVAGAGAWFHWGAGHFNERLHPYDFFHYFLGAKYFPELGYTGLYECVSLAEAEQGFRRRVELRTIRDLRKNVQVPGEYVLEDPERVQRGFLRPFTPERWKEFSADVAYFRGSVQIERWHAMLKDHGYNASPAWNMTGSLLARGPASDRLIGGFLSWIDPVLLVAAFGFVLWGFGWRTACVAVLFFGTSYPSMYFWTGGSYLRQDWLLWAVAGICLLRRGHPALGGAGLAMSALLRVFPAAFFVGIAIRALWTLHRERRVERSVVRLVGGAALATVVVAVASSAVAGSPRAWTEFFRNTAKHASTPLSNHMGLRTVLSFQWEARQDVLYDPGRVDPYETVKEARREPFRRGPGAIGIAALIAAYLGLLAYALRRPAEPWVAATLGFGVIVVAMELTCYYYSFFTVAAFLGEEREEIPIGLLLLSALTGVIGLATHFNDVRYYLESMAVVGFTLWATWRFARLRRDQPAVRLQA